MWSSDPLQRHPRPQLTLSPSGSGGEGRDDTDATTNELRDVAQELRRVERKLAAIEVLEMTEWTAIRAATTHVRLLCRPSGYAFAEADEPPPLVGESLEADGEAFVVERFRPSPFPDDCRRCAVLVAART